MSDLKQKPVYPIIGSIGHEDHGGKGVYMNHDGMSLLEYYSGLAMQALTSNSIITEAFKGNDGLPVPHYIAAHAVELAKALVTELEKQPAP